MKNQNDVEICVALANHWSYTGIGWSLGLESCAQSISDSLAMADFTPSVKTGINMDAYAYELVARDYPEIIERLKTYLDEQKVEIIGGTFGQPMGSMVSGESNLRQLVVGQQTIRAALGGRGVSVFLEEEEMTHPQIPQLVKLVGYKYASLMQCDTWGKHGAPKIERNIINWQGVDGTQVLATPSNAMVFHPPVVTHDMDWLWTDAGAAALVEMKKLPEPTLVLKWTEFGWESLTGKSMNKFDPELFKTISSKFKAQYVTIEQYLDRYGAAAKIDPTPLKMDDFAKLLPWGVGGDQIRRYGREVEAVLTTAERFDAIAHALGRETAPDALAQLTLAWRHLLAAQSHDVSLCEYSRWQGLIPPRDPKIDVHFLTWGAMGYRDMDRAMEIGRPIRQRSLESIASAIDTRRDQNCLAAAIVFNPAGFERDAMVSTGKIQLNDRDARGLRVRDAAGKEVPWQIIGQSADAAGKLVCATVEFQAKKLPSIGYDTYYVEPLSAPAAAPTTDLRIDEASLRMENAHVSVTLDPLTGAIASLVDRRSGNNLIDGKKRAFPILTGRPNNDAIPKRHAHNLVESFDTSKRQAELTWVERGPLRATLRTSHTGMRYTRFETYVTLFADSPAVHVHARLFPDVPPKTGEGNVNGWQFPLEIEEGYWLEFAPAFAPASIVRDYPFGVEPCAKNAIDALTFVDLIAPDGAGLLITHSGTQYFKRLDNGVFANLVVREWESHMTGEYGWPRVCEYRYTLTPHGADLTNADRLHAAQAMDLKPRCVVMAPREGKLPKRQSFIGVGGDNGAILSALRRSSEDALELRVASCDGKPARVHIDTAMPISHARPTNALGEPSGDLTTFRQSNEVSLRPWEIRNLELTK